MARGYCGKIGSKTDFSALIRFFRGIRVPSTNPHLKKLRMKKSFTLGS
jgi:hypothetical protein